MLSTDVLYLYVITFRDGKHQKCEETQSTYFGLGNVKCEDDIEMELVVRCERDEAGEINGK